MAVKPLAKYRQDPDANLDYTIDWSRWLVDGDTITSLAVLVTAQYPNDPDPMVVTWSGFTATETAARVAGGGAGKTYDVTYRIKTAQQRADDRTIAVTCLEK